MRSAKPCWRKEAATWKPAWPAPTIKTDFCVIGSNWYDTKRQSVKAAERVVQPALRFGRQFERFDVFCKRSQDRFCLQAGHRLPDAAMNAGAKRHMPGRAAVHIENIRPFPPARVAVGGRQKQQDLLAFAELNAADLDRSRGGAEESLDRRLEAQHLFEGIADQVRIVAQSLPLLAIARHAVERVAEAVDGGVNACRQERAHQHAGFVLREIAGID